MTVVHLIITATFYMCSFACRKSIPQALSILIIVELKVLDFKLHSHMTCGKMFRLMKVLITILDVVP